MLADQLAETEPLVQLPNQQQPAVGGEFPRSPRNRSSQPVERELKRLTILVTHSVSHFLAHQMRSNPIYRGAQSARTVSRRSSNRKSGMSGAVRTAFAAIATIAISIASWTILTVIDLRGRIPTLETKVDQVHGDVSWIRKELLEKIKTGEVTGGEELLDRLATLGQDLADSSSALRLARDDTARAVSQRSLLLTAAAAMVLLWAFYVIRDELESTIHSTVSRVWRNSTPASFSDGRDHSGQLRTLGEQLAGARVTPPKSEGVRQEIEL